MRVTRTSCQYAYEPIADCDPKRCVFVGEILDLDRSKIGEVCPPVYVHVASAIVETTSWHRDLDGGTKH
jgi:hypothetical protein